MVMLPVQVPAPIEPGNTETVRNVIADVRTPLVGVTESQPVPQVVVLGNAVNVPLPLIEMFCAGGAAPPGVATLKVRFPVPPEDVALMVRTTCSVAVWLSEVVMVTVPV